MRVSGGRRQTRIAELGAVMRRREDAKEDLTAEDVAAVEVAADKSAASMLAGAQTALLELEKDNLQFEAQR